MLTGAALDRPVVGEHLHAVDQRHDAVGLVADQAGQLARPTRRRLALQQLRRAADARQRVLHLVRQHAPPCRHRAGGAAGVRLAVDLVGDRCARAATTTDQAASVSTIGRRRCATRAAPRRGSPSVTSYSDMPPPVARTCCRSAEQRAVGAGKLGRAGGRPASAGARRRRTARPRGWRVDRRSSPIDQQDRRPTGH